MNKFYNILVTIFIATPLFSNSSKISNLDYWVPFSGGDARPMQLIVDKFNSQHSNINVKMRIIRWSEYYDTLENSIQTNSSPNIAIVHATLLQKYISTNKLVDLDKYNINWNEFANSLLSYIKYQNINYALPLDAHPILLYFNKKYLKQAGLLDDKQKPIIQDGVEGFVDFFNTLKDSLPNKIVPLSSANLNVYPFWIWYSLYTQQIANKGYIVNNKAMFNNEAGRKALDVLKELRERSIWSGNIHDEKGYNLFKFNKAATMITGTWATWNFSQNENLDYGVTTFPKLFDKASNFGDAHTLVVLKQKDKQIENDAVTFIKWLSNNSYEWGVSGQIPANKSVTNSKRFLALPHRDLYLQAAEFISFYPKHRKLQECNEIMIKTMADFMHSDNSVDETLKSAEYKINRILEKK